MVMQSDATGGSFGGGRSGRSTIGSSGRSRGQGRQFGGGSGASARGGRPANRRSQPDAFSFGPGDFRDPRVTHGFEYDPAFVGRDYVGGDATTVAVSRLDPTLRNLSAGDAASAITAALTGAAAPDERTQLAADTYGYRRGDVSPEELTESANKVVAADRGLLGRIRDYVTNVDRTIPQDIVVQRAQVTPNFDRAPTPEFGLQDTAEAYSDGLVQTDEQGRVRQDAVGQALEIAAPLAETAVGIGLTAFGGVPGLLGRQIARSQIQPGVNLGTVQALTRGDLTGALASASPIGEVAQAAQRVGRINAALTGGSSNRALAAKAARQQRNQRRQERDRQQGGLGNRSGLIAQVRQPRGQVDQVNTPDYLDSALATYNFLDPVRRANRITASLFSGNTLI